MNAVAGTRPFRTSSGVRSEYKVMAYPCRSNPKASCRPAWPEPTMAIFRMRSVSSSGGYVRRRRELLLSYRANQEAEHEHCAGDRRLALPGSRGLAAGRAGRDVIRVRQG